ncbi:MAG: tRNA uracil 4-sulfurtransferase ThiI [Eubacteriales bacterium]|nr:tRNA uracil 4-sulfurtransferase ThiI [Eubacteriales bacterium]
MFKAFLIKYGEIGLKGKNRYLFEDALVARIREALAVLAGEFTVRKEQGRIFVDGEDFDYDAVTQALQRVFGIVGICPMYQCDECDIEKIKPEVVRYMEDVHPDFSGSFKVHSRRADKRYPIKSMDVNKILGEVILNHFPQSRVDVHTPELMIQVEIREHVYIYTKIIEGQGGMPVGTNGRAMLLLSGGIDSPVAGYMVAKRGVSIDAVYFHAPPYTSERAKDKVVDLAKLVSRYSGHMNLYVVNFTAVQLKIYEKCPHDELTIIMRRYMMKIAEHFAAEKKAHALITGESLGQVASQTIQSLAVTNECCQLPVLRPLIAFDKRDIVKIAETIGTFETSILPYEDCCTIFVAKHPVTKPNLERIKRSERNLEGEIEALVQEAIETTECVSI